MERLRSGILFINYRTPFMTMGIMNLIDYFESRRRRWFYFYVFSYWRLHGSCMAFLLSRCTSRKPHHTKILAIATHNVIISVINTAACFNWCYIILLIRTLSLSWIEDFSRLQHEHRREEDIQILSHLKIRIVSRCWCYGACNSLTSYVNVHALN